jgi:leucyl-tRNA synthetase
MTSVHASEPDLQDLATESTDSQAVDPGYEADAIQARWQTIWEKTEQFVAPAVEDPQGRCAYIFAACPSLSQTTPIQDIRSYSISDSYSRFLRARGHTVLFSIGFDAFGLAAELGAIDQDMSPAAWVKSCVERTSDQFRRLGVSVDWSRTFVSSDPDMYQWSQRLFLLLHEHGLVYRADGQVQWCDNCHTVLAGAQVKDDLCWCCGGPVQTTERSQWYLRFGAYVHENEERLNELTKWNALALETQRAVLGGIDGVEFDVTSLDGTPLTLFTPHAEAIKQAEFVAISPNHPDIEQWLEAEEPVEDSQDNEANFDGTVITTARLVSGVGTESPLPVIISPTVDERFGPTAVLGIPAVDSTDAALAKQIKASTTMAWRIKDKGPSSIRPTQRSIAHDIPIARPKAWGTPIPMIHCESCGTVAVPLTDLPVALPDDLRLSADGNHLAQIADFLTCSCPNCSGPARRESDTLDPHFDRLWQWIALCIPSEDRAKALFDHPDLEHWLPATRVVTDTDSGGLMFDQRITAKALRDHGSFAQAVNGEPFTAATMHAKVLLDKAKEHLDLDDLLTEMGADTVRLSILYGAAPANALTWIDHTLSYCHRWLSSFWQYAATRLEGLDGLAESDDSQGALALRRRLSKWCRIATERVTENFESLEMHRAARNVMMLLVRIEDFEQRVIQQYGQLTPADSRALADALITAVQLLAPLTPHLAEELWAKAGREGPIAGAPWPEISPTPALD